MSSITRRLRSLLIALAVLAISATVVMAAKPSALPEQAGSHRPDATDESGATETDTPETPEATETDTPETPEATETDTPETPEATETDTPDGEAGVHPDNHGKLVSEAAQAETPDGFDNHGAWVRSVAHDNPGHSADKAAAKAAKKAKH